MSRPIRALQPPFPYFGGKRRVAALVWSRLGDCRNYLEPFFGSGAVLLGRPTPFRGVETVNDLDGLVANFWRATKADPDAVADHADHPVLENDLHARHAWLVGRKESLQARLEGDPDYFDAKVAGWWAWGISCWIGSGFCSGKGPWRVVEADDGSRQLVNRGKAGHGVWRQVMYLKSPSQGVNRPHADTAATGQGVNRTHRREDLFTYFRALAERLRNVRVCCGDWSRIMGPSVALEGYRSYHPIGVFLDPPYADTAGRDRDLYARDDLAVAHRVREWALEHGDDPRYRICLAGFAGEHEMPDSWSCLAWTNGVASGYGAQKKTGYANAGRERLWFSRYCARPGLLDLGPHGEVDDGEIVPEAEDAARHGEAADDEAGQEKAAQRPLIPLDS